jgi:hypothetical protein
MKDKAYWQAYNQKRKDYLSQKRQESRRRAKGLSTTDQIEKVVGMNLAGAVVDCLVVDVPEVVDIKSKPVIDFTEPKVVDRSVVDNNHQQVVDIAKVVDTVVDQKPKPVVDKPISQRKVVDNTFNQVVDKPILTQLIQTWQSHTNYNCASTCAYSYCNNCWYFANNQLIDYKKSPV